MSAPELCPDWTEARGGNAARNDLRREANAFTQEGGAAVLNIWAAEDLSRGYPMHMTAV